MSMSTSTSTVPATYIAIRPKHQIAEVVSLAAPVQDAVGVALGDHEIVDVTRAGLLQSLREGPRDARPVSR